MAEIRQLGPHRFLCGDITDGAVERLMGDDRADVIYSDPPWGPGNQQYWHTMNSRGSVPRTAWSGFLAAFCDVCTSYRNPNAPVFIEMGMRWVGDLDVAMRSAGLSKQRRWLVTYGPKSKPLPVTLNLYGSVNVDVVLPDPPHGEPVTLAALSAVVHPGTVVLDPCAGLGMTARITHKLGGVFCGTELNQTRLARAIEGVQRGRRT